MIQSMTGYAAAAGDCPGGRISIELRSVNSRFLDLQFRVAEELRMLEPALRQRIVARLSRGKVDCRVYLNEAGAGQAAPALDARAGDKLKALAAQAARLFPQAEPLRLADILRWPGVVAQASGEDAAVQAVALSLMQRALDELVAARSREGAKLAEIVRARVADMRRRLEAVAPEIPQAIAAYEARLIAKLREAMGTGNEERIRAEVALFAAKVDVDEELERLKTHFEAVEKALEGKAGADSAVGKRLDFLAQELNREANTLASKAASGAIADCALELKLLIEQVREQVQNIE